MFKKNYSLIFPTKSSLEKFESFLRSQEIYSLEVCSPVNDVGIENEKRKICTICKEKKNIDYFARDKQRSDGRRPSCKECNKRKREEKEELDIITKIAEIKGVSIEEGKSMELVKKLIE
jgi:hypothetical protein